MNIGEPSCAIFSPVRLRQIYIVGNYSDRQGQLCEYCYLHIKDHPFTVLTLLKKEICTGSSQEKCARVAVL